MGTWGAFWESDGNTFRNWWEHLGNRQENKKSSPPAPISQWLHEISISKMIHHPMMPPHSNPVALKLSLRHSLKLNSIHSWSRKCIASISTPSIGNRASVIWFHNPHTRIHPLTFGATTAMSMLWLWVHLTRLTSTPPFMSITTYCHHMSSNSCFNLHFLPSHGNLDWISN